MTRTDADLAACDTAAEVEIIVDVARFDVDKIQRRRDSINASASNRGQSTEAADDFGGDEHVNFVDSKGSIHFTLHQTTKNTTAVGVTTGDRYAFSGPLTFSASGSTSQNEPPS